MKAITHCFRVDASLETGIGHVMRCLTLAQALRNQGAECHFISRDLPGHMHEYVRAAGFAVSNLPTPALPFPIASGPPHAAWLGVPWEVDAEQSEALLSRLEPAWLVVDHYALDRAWESAVGRKGLRLLAVDDLADRPHQCAILLDQSLGRQPRDYECLVEPATELLLGPSHALLRPEFPQLRERSLLRRKKGTLKQILITMGGVDRNDATSAVLKALMGAQLPTGIGITVVMGPRAPWLQKVRELAVKLPWQCEVLVSVHDMAALMCHSDLVIGAAGSTSWERCCLGIPTMSVVLAENQRLISRALADAGAALELGEPESVGFDARLREAVIELVTRPQLLVSLSLAASAVTSGGGAERVARRLAVGGS